MGAIFGLKTGAPSSILLWTRTCSSDTDDDDDFGDVLEVEHRHTPAQESIVVSTAHAAEETTSSSDDSLARKSPKRSSWNCHFKLQFRDDNDEDEDDAMLQLLYSMLSKLL